MDFLNKLFGKKQGTTASSGNVQPQHTSMQIPDPSNKKEIALELGKVIDYRQIYKIQKYLNDESVEVRRAAISSLEQQWTTGDAIGIMALTEKLRDSDAKVRETAAVAIGEFIPCAKTPYAIEMGSNAIKELLKLLETEQDESVLDDIFISLANIDDPNLIPSFSKTVKKLKLPTIYIGIRNISLLRSTNTRKEMISSLQSIEAGLDTSTDTSNKSDMGDYHGKPIKSSNVEVLMALENQIGKQIPIVTAVDAWTFGAVIENNQVVELGLNDLNLVSIPENIGQLTGLRVLWLASNKIKALPESFGNLTSLKKLLMQRNEITSLPDSTANLDNLKFLRLDEKVKTNISDNVAKWLEKQEKKLGHGQLLWD